MISFGTAILAQFCTLAAHAAGQELAVKRPLLTTGPDLQLPGIGRVLFGLFLTVALAVVAIRLLKPALARWGKRSAADQHLDVVGRVALNRAVTMHVVRVGGSTIVVTEGRGTISTAVLPASSPAAPDQP